jgi:sortase (surface protein transpeptidase)
MNQAGLTIAWRDDAGVGHLGSQTIAGMDEKTVLAHHRKFVTAQENYIRKWGRLPEGMQRQL